MPDLSAYPQFALYYVTGFRGGDDILENDELTGLAAPHDRSCQRGAPMLPEDVRVREMPYGSGARPLDRDR